MPNDAITEYLPRWRVALDGEPFETPSSWLAHVKTADGQAAVLKLPKPASDEHGLARVFAHWGDRAAVRVLAHDASALLMERAAPGTTLVPLVLSDRDDEATERLCDVIQGIHWRPAPADNGFKRIDKDWGKGFARQRARPPHPLLTYDVIDRAAELYLELCASQSDLFLLHGDLHHENVLIDAQRGPLAIDPKGVIGEIAFEVTAALGNPIPHVEIYAHPDIMERRVRIFAERLSLPPERILNWARAAWTLRAIWFLNRRKEGDIVRGLDVAETARELLGETR